MRTEACMFHPLKEMKARFRWSALALAALILCAACGEEETVAEAIAQAVAERAAQSSETQEASAADLLLVLVALAEISETDFAMEVGPGEEITLYSPATAHGSPSTAESDRLAKLRSFQSMPSPDPAPETGPGAKSSNEYKGLGATIGGGTTETMRTAVGRASISPDPAPEGPDAQ